MNCMDDNPYQSPKPVPEAEKPPAKPLSRNGPTVRNAFLTFVGLVVLQMMIVEILIGLSMIEFNIHPVLALQRTLLLRRHAIVAFPFAAAMALWTWLSPKSGWPSAVAITLAVSPIVLGMIGVLVGLI